MRRQLRIAFVGWGAISQRASDLLLERCGANLAVVAVGLRETSARRGEIPCGAAIVTEPEALLRHEPDLVIEAAGRQAVGHWAPATLTAGRSFLVSSGSALAEPGVLARLVALAEEGGGQIVLPAGALGGIDALASASCLPLDAVTHTIVKPPRAWQGTVIEQTLDLGRLSRAVTFFSGSAREAAEAYPQNANSVVTSALAGLGLDRTQVRLVADPEVLRNSHRIVASGAFGTLDVRLANEPLAGNPKSSVMTALNIVRTVVNQVQTFVM